MSKPVSNSVPEFSRIMDRRAITAEPVKLVATADERAALAQRFDIVSIGGLVATLMLQNDGDAVAVTGRLQSSIVQSCAISGDDLPVRIDEPLTLRFVPERSIEAEEIELEEEDLDEIPFTGTAFDLGEAIAQTLALAIDPYLTGPNADKVRVEVGLAEKAPDGPLQQALAKLKKPD